MAGGRGSISPITAATLRADVVRDRCADRAYSAAGQTLAVGVATICDASELRDLAGKVGPMRGSAIKLRCIGHANGMTNPDLSGLAGWLSIIGRPSTGQIMATPSGKARAA